jgi:PEP-CTERM motif
MKHTLAIVFLAAMAPLTASASIIQLTLQNSTLSAAPGNSVTFFATATNTAGVTENLNSDSLTVLTPLVGDDSPFVNNWPFLLAPGASFGAPDALFTVLIPIGTAANSYVGDFEILGGPGQSDSNNLALVNFTVNVTSGVPEPSTMFLAGGTLAVAALLSRRRRRVS